MADEPKPVEPAPQPAPQPAPEPAPAPQPAPAPEPAPAPAPEPKPEPAKPAAHTDTETLLEGAKPPEPKPETKPEAKPGEKPPEAAKPEEKKPEAKPGETPDPKPEPKTYEAFKLAEGMSPDNESMTAFTGILGKHNLTQEAGQELIDLHTGSLKKYAEHLATEQHRIFGETRAGWRKDVMADEMLGGAGHQTAMAAVARMRDLFVPEAERQSFNDMLRITGAGDHPAFLRLLLRAARFFDEPPPQPQGKPPADRGPKAGMRTLRDIYADSKTRAA